MPRSLSIFTFFLLLSLFLGSIFADSNLPTRSPTRGQKTFTPALKSSPRLQNDLEDRITPRDIFGRQTCASSLYQLCSNYGRCCSKLSTCCSRSCTPSFGKCCSDGYSCDSGEDCCGDGCKPTFSECCGNGSYCTHSMGTCYNDKGTWKCMRYISGDSSGAAVNDGPLPKVLGGMALAGLGAVNLL